MHPLTVQQLLEVLDGELVSETSETGALRSLEICSVSTDSRTIQPQDLFFALSGPNFDGHDYLQEVCRARAAAAVVQRIPEEPLHLPFIRVKHTTIALQKLANWNRRMSDAVVIGITGSVGKTTTKQMLYQTLANAFPGCASPASFNNHIGVPLSLLQIEPQTEFAVIEIGTSRVGEIEHLAGIAQPEIGIVTEVGAAHLQGLQSVDQVAWEKSQLLNALPTSGIEIIPSRLQKHPAFRTRRSSQQMRTGTTPCASVRAEQVRKTDSGIQFAVEDREYHLPTLQPHWLDSALITIALCREFGCSTEMIQQGLDQFAPLPGRGNQIPTYFGRIIDETYNANPVSVISALRNFTHHHPQWLKIAVLGDLQDLGEHSIVFHRQVGREVARARLDFLLTLGPLAGEIARAAHHGGMPLCRIASFEQIQDLLMLLELWLEAPALVLVKGSRGMQMERIVEALQQPHSEQYPSGQVRIAA